MEITKPGLHLGRYVYGLAVLIAGVATVVWHDYNDWSHPRYLVYAAGAALIVGGVAIQIGRAAKMGACAVAAVYFVFALLCVPRIFAAPRIYNSWGNFFEQFSLLTGAVMVYARLTTVWPRQTVSLIGRVFLAICAASFALEQAFYLAPTASLVPKWIPPSPMFWAVTTTVFFGLAGVALLLNLKTLLAARLLTLMLVMFGLLVWAPLLVAEPRSHANWSESAETLAIAGAAWILADLLAELRKPD